MRDERNIFISFSQFRFNENDAMQITLHLHLSIYGRLKNNFTLLGVLLHYWITYNGIHHCFPESALVHLVIFVLLDNMKYILSNMIWYMRCTIILIYYCTYSLRISSINMWNKFDKLQRVWFFLWYNVQ